jgi:hypothetical protein
MIVEDNRKLPKLEVYQNLIVACLDECENYVFKVLEERIDIKEDELKVSKLDEGIVKVSWMHHVWYIITDLDENLDQYFYVAKRLNHNGEYAYQDELSEACCAWVLSEFLNHKFRAAIMSKLWKLKAGPVED